MANASEHNVISVACCRCKHDLTIQREQFVQLIQCQKCGAPLRAFGPMELGGGATALVDFTLEMNEQGIPVKPRLRTVQVHKTIRYADALSRGFLCGSDDVVWACDYCQSAVCDGCGANELCPFCSRGSAGAATLRPITEEDRRLLRVMHSVRSNSEQHGESPS